MRSLSYKSSTLQSTGRILLPVFSLFPYYSDSEVYQECNALANKNYSALDCLTNLTLSFTVKLHQDTHRKAHAQDVDGKGQK